jgi:uncharacterized protein YaaW (UPF0174 family)
MNESLIKSLKKAKLVNDKVNLNKKIDENVIKKTLSNNSFDNIVDDYESSVMNSRLPENIKKAMLEKPINTMDINMVTDKVYIDENAKRMINPDLDEKDDSYEEKDYLLEEEYNKKLKQLYKQKNNTAINENENSVHIDESYLKKLIDNRISKLLPEIIDNYFDKRIIGEDVQIKVGGTIFSGNLKPLPKKK